MSDLNSLKELFYKDVTVEYIPRDGIPNEFGETKGIYYESTPYLGRKTTTFAYFGIPTGEVQKGGFPAIVLVHGGGGCAFYEWVEYWNGKGYAAIAFDCSGRQFGSKIHDCKDTAEINPNGRFLKEPDNGSYSNTEENIKDSWTYHNVANVILANNILRADARINSEKIVVTGISWGGVLTALTSGIDHRFAAFAPVYGTGCLTNRKSFRLSGAHLIMEIAEWEKLFDPRCYTVNSVKPMLHTLGMDDPFFTCFAAMETYGQTKCKMRYSYRKELSHYHRWMDEEQMLHVSKFMDLVCRDAALPFDVTAENVKDGVFSVNVENAERVKAAYLTYTASVGDDHTEWKWEQARAEFCGGTFTAELPEGAKYYFCELHGDDGMFVLSSAIHAAE